MRSIKFLFLSFLSVIAFSVKAQTVDEIVEKYITAVGGKERLESLTSVKMSGTLSTQGIDIPITITRAHGVGIRVDIEVMGSANYQLCNATEGWVFMPVQGMTEPTKMEEDQYKSFSSQLDVQGALYNYKSKGHTVEFIGKESVDGAEAYKLKLTLKSGKVSHYFIDTKTNYLIKTTSMVSAGGEEREVANSFSNFKQTADGYWFPYTTTNMQGPINFDKIETNVKVEETLFKN